MKSDNSWAFTRVSEPDLYQRARLLAGSPLASCTWRDNELPAWAGRIAELEDRERELQGRVDLARATLDRLKNVSAKRPGTRRISWVALILSILALVGVLATLASRLAP